MEPSTDTWRYKNPARAGTSKDEPSDYNLVFCCRLAAGSLGLVRLRLTYPHLRSHIPAWRLASIIWNIEMYSSEERDRRSSEGRTSVSRHFNIYISNLSCVFPWNFGSHQRVHFTEIPWKNTREIGNVNIEMPGNRCSALTRPSVSFWHSHSRHTSN